MPRRRPEFPPSLPVLLQRRHSDEFSPPPWTTRDRAAVAEVIDRGPGDARRTATPLAHYWAGRRGTAAGLRAIDANFDETFYAIPKEATLEETTAELALGGDETVIDVQTHYVADRPATEATKEHIRSMYRHLSPEWWKGVDEAQTYGLAEYLECVFLQSETAVAVLTSGPGTGPERMLFNEEMAGTRALFERLEAHGRLLNHAVIHADHADEIARMDEQLEHHRPAGWKCYTLGTARDEVRGWWLDDERTGIPFIERAIELGLPRICAHKGISALVDNGSPRDIGPVAAAFPNLELLVYHSGWEVPQGDEPEEGPYTEETAHLGVNRLIHTLRENGVGRGANVYAELGSTWFGLIRRPDEAAHVLGKLLHAVGPDNVLWGTDSIWYGPSQVAIDAFRAFQIPLSYQQQFGYPALTDEIKRKILGGNAARVYGIDLDEAKRSAADDDLAWLKRATDEYRRSGVPGARKPPRG